MKETKKIGNQKQAVQHASSNAWEVMKPFVNFGVKATGLLAHTLITIVKNIPKPDSNKTNRSKDNRIIKI